MSPQSKPKRGGRVDANQDDHVKTLTRVGAIVEVISNAGNGIPDLLVWVDDKLWDDEEPSGSWFLIETKDGKKPPSKRKLTKHQEIFHAKFKDAADAGHLIVSNHPDEALAAIGAI